MKARSIWFFHRHTQRPAANSRPRDATEHLVGTLPALHHLAVTRDSFGEQIETDAIMAHHGFAHGLDGLGQAAQQLGFGHKNAFMHRTKALRDDIGVFELVALLASHVLEADVVGTHVGDPGLGHQAQVQAA